jgi:prevent-host-death family protein
MLNVTTDIKPISYFKSHTAEMIRQVGDSKNPIVITQNGEAKAVIIDVDSYQDLINTINLMKIISIGDRDIKNGNVVTHEDVKKRITTILG